MIHLPNVTLLVVHGDVATDLTRLALTDTLAQIKPAQTIVFTPSPEDWKGFNTIPIQPCKSAREALKVYWYTAPQYVATPFRLHIEWDGWVLNGDMWDDTFLSYDYIGAPWPWHPPGRQVGNGLGIRSTRLMNFLASDPIRFPLPSKEEDTAICHTYRRDLEQNGFRFAPAGLASRFSWERGMYPGPTFMFHGAFNWTRVLTPANLEKRLSLCDDYIKSKPEWSEVMATVYAKRSYI